MCNDYWLHVDVDALIGAFAELKIKIRFSEGKPNVEARDDIKITDVGPSSGASTTRATQAT